MKKEYQALSQSAAFHEATHLLVFLQVQPYLYPKQLHNRFLRLPQYHA